VEAVSDVVRWLFFADYTWSPMALSGMFVVGWFLRGWREGRRGSAQD
jgi:hypothetical protein